MNRSRFSHFSLQLVAAGIFAMLTMFSTGNLVHAQPFRTIDGSNNNAMNTDWGQAGTALLRLAPADYPGDGTGDTFIQPPTRPNARVISNELFDQNQSISSANRLSSGVWQWGQFLDHDIDLSPGNGDEPHMIFAPLDDPDGMMMIPMNRSATVDCVGCVRQQINAITSYIDGSNVYGSDLGRAGELRLGQGGRLLTSAGDMLPTTDMVNTALAPMDTGGNPATMFAAGDFRANEQLGLTAMHTVFLREHNRIAGELIANGGYDPVADDELIYLKARSIVGAEIQAITYNEFLPMLLGDFAPTAADYNYDPTVDASIANVFSTALFRVGHTMLNENLWLAGEKGNVTGQIPLRAAFFTGAEYWDDKPALIDELLMGLASQTAQEIDTQIVDDVRNFLFAPHVGMGFDLASLNIERGRDHGLPDYNTIRSMFEVRMAGVEGFNAVDLSAAASFAELDADPAVIAVLESLYDSVDNLDVWVAALAETHVDGANVGPLVLAGLVDQFTRLRDGDSHFYTGNSWLWSDEVADIVSFDDLRFMDIVTWNTNMKNSPMDFFNAPIPEPASGILAALLLAGLGSGRWRRRRA